MEYSPFKPLCHSKKIETASAAKEMMDEHLQGTHLIWRIPVTPAVEGRLHHSCPKGLFLILQGRSSALLHCNNLSSFLAGCCGFPFPLAGLATGLLHFFSSFYVTWISGSQDQMVWCLADASPGFNNSESVWGIRGRWAETGVGWAWAMISRLFLFLLCPDLKSNKCQSLQNADKVSLLSSTFDFSLTLDQ